MRPRRNIILFSSDAADLSTRRFVYEHRLKTIRCWGASTTHDLCDVIVQTPDPRLAVVVWKDPVSARKAADLLKVGLPDVPLLFAPNEKITSAEMMALIHNMSARKTGPKPGFGPKRVSLQAFEMKEAG
jgi:hypothetical protein